MRIVSLDWKEVLARLPEWDALSPAARLAFLRIKPSQGAAVAEVGAPLAELREAGMVTATEKRVVGTERYHTLLVALRSLHRAEAGDVPGARLSPRYLQDNFEDAELRRIAPRTELSYGYVDRAGIVARASSVEWVEDFLALRDPGAVKAWEEPRLLAGEAPYLRVREVWEALSGLVRLLGEHPRGVPLGALATLIPHEELRAAVLVAGLRYLLLFPRIRVSTAEAVVGLIPAVADRFGPPPPPPAPVEPAETFEAPFLVADMTTVMVEATTTPIPLRGGDGAMYVRSQKMLAPRLQSIPAWVWRAMDVDVEETEPESVQELLAGRVTDGARMLLNFGLARTAVDENDKYQLTATGKGKRWLALPEGDRIRELLDGFRASEQRNPDGWYGTVTGREFFPSRLGFDLPKTAPLDLRTALAAAFLSIPPGAMVPLEGFLRHHAVTANPFLAAGPDKLVGRAGYSSLRPSTREEWEQLWSQLLRAFFELRLVPFGGARVGMTEEDEVCVGVTALGRYLLGATDEWEYAPPAAGEVVVQPDFEILFLAPAPRLEAELARIADRIGSGVGALFRITRASVLRAAEQGMAADGALAMLEGISRTGVPANVARQIRDWMTGTRRVSLHTALLIECPDPETAARVLAFTGGHGVQLTPTLLRVPTHALDRKTFVRKLREKGIFVSGAGI